jgi:hypothetical protein
MTYEVKPPVIRATLKQQTYKTRDIMREVQEVLTTDRDDTANFARKFTADLRGMKMLYDEVNERITYIEDPMNYQWVQTPSYLWHHTRRGDCKSLAVFISTVLQNMGVTHLVRYVSYDFTTRKGRYTHVYVVAIINGQNIPLDVTYEQQDGASFGDEKPFARKFDYIMKPGLYKLGNVSTALTTREKQYVDDVEATVREMELALADIPDSVVTEGDGDITAMSDGQIERNVWKDRFRIYATHEVSPSRRQKYMDAAVAMETGSVAGIYGLDGDPLGRQVQSILKDTAKKQRPAFENFKIKLTQPADPALSGFFKKVGDFFKKVGNKIGDLFKKFVNWIWKGPAKAMGPYFLFLFANKNKVRSPEMKRRIKAQEKSFNFIVKAGKFKEDQLKGVMLNGIKENTGADTKDLFQAAKATHISGLPVLLAKAAAFVIKAVSWVIKVIQKVVSLFKKNKNEAGTIDEGNSSDVNLLVEEARLQEEAEKGSGGASGGGSSSGGGSAGLFAGLAALSVPLLLRAA